MDTHFLFKTGDTLGDFVLQKRLGAGAFKTVYQAENRAPEKNLYPKTVALCIPHTQDGESREQLRRECLIQQTLKHPAIVAMYGFEEAEPYFFAVTELAEGKTLSILLEETGPIPFERAVAWVKQVADALDYAPPGLPYTVT